MLEKITERFSVIIPALNATDRIDSLLANLLKLDLPFNNFEIIVVGDGSHNNMSDKLRTWQKQSNVRLFENPEKTNLATPILAAAAAARSDVIVVMNPNLDHSSDQLMAMVNPILNNDHDLTIGSRYMAGNNTTGQPLYWQWLSHIGSWVGRLVCDVSDVSSGFFAFRRYLIKNIPEHTPECKILLELLAANQEKLKVAEIPVHCLDQTRNSPKSQFSHQWGYLQRLTTSANNNASAIATNRFTASSLCYMIIDVLLFQWLFSQEAGLAQAHIISFLAATTVHYLLNSEWSFRSHTTDYKGWDKLGRFLTINIFALLMRGGVLALLISFWEVPALLAIFPAIVLTGGINYLGSIFYVSPIERGAPSPHMRWRIASIGIVTFVVLLRLIYLGQAQLIPDEAYYWKYAQHMDWSFFDHPPMVAWLIWLGTAIFGDNEFGVRIGAWVSGLVTMGYLYALTINLYDKSTGMRAVMLLAVLPFGFAMGILMTPDAPLLAAWAATLYYMERALLNNRNSAWLGIGIAFGLGILSKYTLGLLGISCLLFVILDPTARRWLRRPHPYFAVALSLLLFSPVIIWNIQHNWVSFLFQTQRASGIGNQFSAHQLLLYILILLTPVGAFGALLALLSSGDCDQDQHAKRRRLFVWVFTGVPLTMFFILSLLGSPKFHWTAPVWLALLPTIAWMISQTSDLRSVSSRLRAAWKPTVITFTFAYAFILHFAVLGVPGIPYPDFMRHYFWREATNEIQHVVKDIQQLTEQEPIVVGMSKWSVASALSFYSHNENIMEIRSHNMFGDSGAMYDFWFPSQLPTTRPIILVGMKREHVERTRQGDDLDQMLDQLGPVQYREIIRDNKIIRGLYYRVARGYTGKQD